MHAVTVRATITNPLSHLCGLSFDFLPPTRAGDAFKIVNSDHAEGLCYHRHELSFAPMVSPITPSTELRLIPDAWSLARFDSADARGVGCNG